MQRIHLVLIFFLIPGLLFAQHRSNPQSFRKNTVFIEILGNAGTYSLNYDRLLYQSKGYKLAGRLGFSFFPKKTYNIQSMPFELSVMFFASGNHHIEIGSGLSYIKGLETKDVITDFTGSRKYVSESLYLPFRLGYRYQRQRGRLFLKAGVIPMIGIYEFEKEFSNKSHVWLGGAIGYSF
jgi:hypothetical protein